MSEPYRFTKYSNPEECRLDVVGGRLKTMYFAAGIVNPMGPTLNILVADGFGAPRDRMKIYKLMFNPFSQTCHMVGEVTVGDEWVPALDLAPFYDLEWGSCPTLLIPSATYSPTAAKDLFVAFLQRFADGCEALTKVQEHPGNPWTRVKAEMDSAVGIMKKLRNRLFKEQQGGPLNAKQSATLASLQLEPKNFEEEFRAFMYAWEGSMNFLRIPGLSKDKFLEIFMHIAMTARIRLCETSLTIQKSLNARQTSIRPAGTFLPRRREGLSTRSTTSTTSTALTGRKGCGSAPTSSSASGPWSRVGGRPSQRSASPTSRPSRWSS